MVTSERAQLDANDVARGTQQIRLRDPVTFRLSTGYTRTLSPDTLWRRVGRIAQGDVFRPVGSVVTIEGRNVHEAYLVLSGNTLVGFYLPGESHYSALSPAVPLTFGETP